MNLEITYEEKEWLLRVCDRAEKLANRLQVDERDLDILFCFRSKLKMMTLGKEAVK